MLSNNQKGSHHTRMRSYIITYEGDGMNETYSGVNVQLRNFFSRARRIHDNVWLVQSPHSADAVLRVLKPHKFFEGGLLVVEVCGTPASTGFKPADARFLREILYGGRQG